MFVKVCHKSLLNVLETKEYVNKKKFCLKICFLFLFSLYLFINVLPKIVVEWPWVFHKHQNNIKFDYYFLNVLLKIKKHVLMLFKS